MVVFGGGFTVLWSVRVEAHRGRRGWCWEGGELRSGRLLQLPASVAFEMHAALLSSLGFKSTIINKILPV